MKKLILKEIINNNVQKKIPTIFPNNIKLINENLGLSRQDIADVLELNVNFVSNVINEKVNFSSLSVIKFMKEFNIPFSLIYNVKREVEIDAYYNPKYFCIYSISKNSTIDTSLIIKDVLESLDLASSSSDKILKFFKVLDKNTLTFNDLEKSENIPNDLDIFTKLSKKIDYNYDEFIYYAILIESCESNGAKQKMYINLNENYNPELIEYLYSKPFEDYKSKKISIPLKDVIEMDYTYKLPKTYDLIINNKVISSDSISKEDCIKKRSNLILPGALCVNTLVKFKELREYKQYSTKEMAEILDISEPTYLNLENGYQRPSISTMWKLEYYVGIFLDCVLNIDEFYNKYCKS